MGVERVADSRRPRQKTQAVEPCEQRNPAAIGGVEIVGQKETST
jgi:hypothetical protein